MAAKKLSPLKPTPQTQDLPATQGMLYLVRGEVKSDIKELRSEMKAGFHRVDSKFEEVMQAIHHLSAEVFRMGVLMEEQNSRNRIVLEGHTLLATRQDRLEERQDETEKTIRSIAGIKS